LVRRLFPLATVMIALCTTCAQSSTRSTEPSWSVAGETDLDRPSHPMAGYSAAFVLTWRGQRIGEAREQLRHRADGFRFTRSERLAIRRGAAVVELNTTIRIDTNSNLDADRVTVERTAGASTTRGAAQKSRDGRWRVWFGSERMRTLPGDAVPAELVNLRVAASPSHTFRGRVLLAGYGFATAHLDVAPVVGQRHRVRAIARTSMGRLVSEISLSPEDGTVTRVHAAEAVEATRADPAQLARHFDPPELVTSSSLPLVGTTGILDRDRVTLRLEGVHRPPPPAMPGQTIQADHETWTVTLDRRPRAQRTRTVDPNVAANFASLAARIVNRAGAYDRTSEIAALSRATEQLLTDDMSNPSTDAGNALALGRGDCTAHAALLTALATARGIPTRMVTGFRIARGRLARHRWIIADAGNGRWIAVDPTYGEAPATARLLGLAVHGAAASEIAMVDELAFAGMRRARVIVVP
jgi:hypothetical protein